MKFRNPFKKKPCNCVRYERRFDTIQRLSRYADRIILGRTQGMVSEGDLNELKHLISMIHIEAMKKDVPLE